MHHVKVIMRSRAKINLISFKFSQIQFQCIALGNGEFYRKQYSKFISSKSYPIHPQRKGANSSRSLTRYFSQSTLETWSIRNYRLRESTHPIQSASRRNWTSNSNSRRVLDVECRRPECFSALEWKPRATGRSVVTSRRLMTPDYAAICVREDACVAARNWSMRLPIRESHSYR